MLQLNPSTRFPIVRKLGDPADVGTNYVRAIVRNSVLGTVLETINLTNEGGQRFVGYYQTPSTDELFIDITTIVYTDSGYTTKSEVYSEENETYLVALRWGLQFNNAVSGREKIDYELIKKMLIEAIEPLKSKKENKAEKVNLSAINKALISLEIGVKRLNEKEVKEVNFKPLEGQIDALGASIKQAIKDKEVTEVDKVDFSPILTALSTFPKSDVMKEDIAKLETSLDKFVQDMKNVFKSETRVMAPELMNGNERRVSRILGKNIYIDDGMKNRVGKLLKK